MTVVTGKKIDVITVVTVVRGKESEDGVTGRRVQPFWPVVMQDRKSALVKGC